MRIQVFPALNGDCILIEYIQSHYILVDGGYIDTYNKYIKPALNSIAESGGEIDLIVASHIDRDHISGIIKLLEDDRFNIPIKNIWYNGYRHVQPITQISEKAEIVVHKNICKGCNSENEQQVSAKGGCTLSMNIQKRGIDWNKHTNGNTLKAPLSVKLDNCLIHVLSPNDDDIQNLSSHWKKELIKKGLLSQAHSNEYWDDAFEFNLSKDNPGFHFHTKKVCNSIDLEKIKCTEYKADDSATNGSSISFIIESEEKKLLFLGDSHAETIIESIKKLYSSENYPLWFDVVKLSHHGSYNNNSPELFKIIDADKWIVSTNGEGYNHPDEATLAHIIAKDKIHMRGIYFNYTLPICEKFNQVDLHNEYQFNIIVPTSDSGIDLKL